METDALKGLAIAGGAVLAVGTVVGVAVRLLSKSASK